MSNFDSYTLSDLNTLRRFVLAIDPGKHNGLALFDDNTGEILLNRSIEADELPGYLAGLQPSFISVVVCEDFIIRPGKNHGSRGEAMQVIGMLKVYCEVHRIKFVLQRPEVRLHAAMMAGEKIPKGHMTDKQSARLHGIAYLRTIGKYETVLEKKKRGTSS